ncbi:MAG: hypothetical protein DRR19_26365 [Candidatus Parabeggiatoa sp. nov. 1]|nr:MAG: hypothetical protein DRR19_26365 [Gammaproteobacteria bacterium]
MPFRALELLDNCFRANFFARKNFGAKSCWLKLFYFLADPKQTAFHLDFIRYFLDLTAHLSLVSKPLITESRVKSKALLLACPPSLLFSLNVIHWFLSLSFLLV